MHPVTKLWNFWSFIQTLGAACKMSKLASTLVDTSAAPTSPNVLGTEVLIVDPDSEIKPQSSTCCHMQRLDRQTTWSTSYDDHSLAVTGNSRGDFCPSDNFTKGHADTSNFLETQTVKIPLPIPSEIQGQIDIDGDRIARGLVSPPCSLHSPTYSGNSGRIPVGIPDSGWIPVGFRLGFRIPGGFRWDSGFRTVFNCYNVFVSTTA